MICAAVAFCLVLRQIRMNISSKCSKNRLEARNDFDFGRLFLHGNVVYLQLEARILRYLVS